MLRVYEFTEYFHCPSYTFRSARWFSAPTPTSSQCFLFCIISRLTAVPAFTVSPLRFTSIHFIASSASYSAIIIVAFWYSCQWSVCDIPLFIASFLTSMQSFGWCCFATHQSSYSSALSMHSAYLYYVPAVTGYAIATYSLIPTLPIAA